MNPTPAQPDNLHFFAPRHIVFKHSIGDFYPVADMAGSDSPSRALGREIAHRYNTQPDLLVQLRIALEVVKGCDPETVRMYASDMRAAIARASREEGR